MGVVALGGIAELQAVSNSASTNKILSFFMKFQSFRLLFLVIVHQSDINCNRGFETEATTRETAQSRGVGKPTK